MPSRLVRVSRVRARLAAAVVVALLAPQAGLAQPREPTAVGLWQQTNPATGKANAWFRVSKHGGFYDATIVKLFKQPKQKQILLCTNCSGVQKDAPLLGLRIVKGMVRDGLIYEDGTILDPRDGSEYYGRMRLSPDGRTLTVRGDLGIDPLGGDETWTRLPSSAAHAIKRAKAPRRSSTSAPAPAASLADPTAHRAEAAQRVWVSADDNSASL